MTIPDMRWAARECVNRAKNLLANGDESSARYACLELRSAIEYLTYDNLQTYRPEMLDEVAKKWQPRELIAAMRDIDPHADMSGEFRVARSGEPPETQEWLSLGKDVRFSIKWITKHYNALGSYLHAPTLHDLEAGRVPSPEKIIKAATTVVEESEQVLNSRIFRLDIGIPFAFNCNDCQTPMKGLVRGPSQKGEMACPKCRAVYGIASDDQGRLDLWLCGTKFPCMNCGKENWMGIHQRVEGKELQCEQCKERFRIVYSLEPLSDEKAA